VLTLLHRIFPPNPKRSKPVKLLNSQTKSF
jgi:hypothetical protein